MASKVNICGVSMTYEAAKNVEENGVLVRKDVSDLRSGRTTPDILLSECLDGASPDARQGWVDYVNAVMEASIA